MSHPVPIVRMMAKCPSAVGATAEREVSYALAGAGWEVFVPMFSPHSRVDLAALRDGEVCRVQVKTSVLRPGVICFRPFSNTANVARSYAGEIEAFGVYSPELGRVYLVPLGGTSARSCRLRLESPANNQQKGIRYAATYEVGAAAIVV